MGMRALGEGLAYMTGVILSCGPSQMFGLIKGGIDLTKLAKIHWKISKIGGPTLFCLRSSKKL